MDNFIDKNELLSMLHNKKIPNEIELSLWEDEYYIWIAICFSYGKLLGEQDYAHINKITKEDYYENLGSYKKEAYRIKRIIKKNFPAIKVSSDFQWK